MVQLTIADNFPGCLLYQDGFAQDNARAFSLSRISAYFRDESSRKKITYNKIQDVIFAIENLRKFY